MEIKRSIEQGWGNGGLYDILVGLNNGLGVMPVAGVTYYVSKTGNSTTGLSWENAYSTLAAAIAQNNIQALATPYAMNRIYVDGGTYTETLVTFPNHCEVIGVGAAPSRIGGVSTLSTACSVTHFYNMQFRATTTSTTNVNLGSSSGVWFIGCIFNHSGSITPTSNLIAGDLAQGLKIINCDFQGTSNLSATTAITIEASTQSGIQIINNRISAITTGIAFGSGMTVMRSGLIQGNLFNRDDGNATQMTNGIVIGNLTGTNQCTMVCDNVINAAVPLTRVDASMASRNYSNVAGTVYLDGIAIS